MAKFCSCGSILSSDNNTCTNSKCFKGTTRKKSINFKGQGFLRNKKTGVMIDKETGTTIVIRKGERNGTFG